MDVYKYQDIAKKLLVCPLDEAEIILQELDHTNPDALVGFYNTYRTNWDLNIKGVDIVGTGGDGKNTFNISTASALVCAASGIKVVKFGNRSATSKSGSVDLLETLGISLARTADDVKRDLENNISFISAREIYPAFQRLSSIRKKIGKPTIFNYLGPLLNPVDLSLTVLGVANQDMISSYVNFFRRVRKTGIVISSQGFDEAIPFQPAKIHYGSRKEEIFYSRQGSLDELTVDSPEQSAEIISNIFEGKDKGIRYDCISLNAGIALAYYHGIDLDDGIRIARNTIDSKMVSTTLKKLQHSE